MRILSLIFYVLGMVSLQERGLDVPLVFFSLAFTLFFNHLIWNNGKGKIVSTS